MCCFLWFRMCDVLVINVFSEVSVIDVVVLLLSLIVVVLLLQMCPSHHRRNLQNVCIRVNTVFSISTFPYTPYFPCSSVSLLPFPSTFFTSLLPTPTPTPAYLPHLTVMVNINKFLFRFFPCFLIVCVPVLHLINIPFLHVFFSPFHRPLRPALPFLHASTSLPLSFSHSIPCLIPYFPPSLPPSITHSLPPSLLHSFPPSIPPSHSPPK